MRVVTLLINVGYKYMSPIFIVRYHQNKRARAVAFTYNEDIAREICSQEETHGSKWFYGWTRSFDGNVHSLPLAEDCLKDIHANPGKKVTA